MEQQNNSIGDHILTDDVGNKLKIMRGTRTIIIKLILKGETRERNIGTVDVNKKELLVSRIRSKHLHIKSNSYGFNYYLLSAAKTFNTVRITDGVEQYVVPLKELIDNGKFLYFKQQGFEKQIFVPLAVLEKYKTAEPII